MTSVIRDNPTLEWLTLIALEKAMAQETNAKRLLCHQPACVRWLLRDPQIFEGGQGLLYAPPVCIPVSLGDETENKNLVGFGKCIDPALFPLLLLDCIPCRHSSSIGHPFQLNGCDLAELNREVLAVHLFQVTHQASPCHFSQSLNDFLVKVGRPASGGEIDLKARLCHRIK